MRLGSQCCPSPVLEDGDRVFEGTLFRYGSEYDQLFIPVHILGFERHLLCRLLKSVSEWVKWEQHILTGCKDIISWTTHTRDNVIVNTHNIETSKSLHSPFNLTLTLRSLSDQFQIRTSNAEVYSITRSEIQSTLILSPLSWLHVPNRTTLPQRRLTGQAPPRACRTCPHKGQFYP
jgi:hypothetical protein